MNQLYRYIIFRKSLLVLLIQ